MDTLYALSNNHVFADCNHVPVGQPIISPSGPDSRPNLPPPRQICAHSEIVELRSGTPALVSPCLADLAIAEIPDGQVVSSWQGDTDGGYDTPHVPADLATGLEVKKWGRTTRLTRGIMQSVQITTSIPYDGQHFRALVWLRGAWTVESINEEAFALPGDSGSLVVTADGKKAVGILFAVAAKGRIAFVIPIDRVLQSFGGINLVSKHGV
ncbi:MAG: hypothetical protein JWP89_2705 [Schlesneria sp.]|nr:hypothetical protein [Schlesneria sp.]